MLHLDDVGIRPWPRVRRPLTRTPSDAIALMTAGDDITVAAQHGFGARERERMSASAPPGGRALGHEI